MHALHQRSGQVKSCQSYRPSYPPGSMVSIIYQTTGWEILFFIAEQASSSTRLKTTGNISLGFLEQFHWWRKQSCLANIVTIPLNLASFDVLTFAKLLNNVLCELYAVKFNCLQISEPCKEVFFKFRNAFNFGVIKFNDTFNIDGETCVDI